MSPRPVISLTVFILIYGAFCLGLAVADAQKEGKSPLFKGRRAEIRSFLRNRNESENRPSSRTGLKEGDLDEDDINKLLPYEAVENIDIPERRQIPLDIIYKYYLPKNKTNEKAFALLDRFSSRLSRNRRQTDSIVTVEKREHVQRHSLKHVPKMLQYFKEAKKNFTQERHQLSLRFLNNANTFTSPRVVVRNDPWPPLFPKPNKHVSLDENFPIIQAAIPSTGYPWPLPQSLKTNPKHVLIVDVSKFHFTLSKNSYNCDILQSALSRYTQHLKELDPASPGNGSSMNNTDRQPNLSGSEPQVVVHRLQVTVELPCTDYPELESHESYDLVVDEKGAVIKAVEVWGALRGLQTFSQLIYICQHLKLCINQTSISDSPRFKHRGIMLDTSRHYISPQILKTNMDVMEMNKLNVLHWHIVDDQSFPFVSQQFPDLSEKGAFSPEEQYSHAVIKELVEYGRLRGIRIVPEFDTPGHVRSWGVGYPEILTNCGPEGMGPIDPSKNLTFEFLNRLFSEVMSLFPDKTLHLGGDECSYHCWRENPGVQAFMRERGFGDDFTKLEDYYFNRLLVKLAELNPKKGFVFWQDIIDNNIKIPSDAIIQIWKGFSGADIRALHKATEMGLRTIHSAAWYLNYISYGKDWVKYYTADPTEYVWTDKAQQLIIGGEACLWGEYIDDNNLLQTLWPRASAVAERLWSAKQVTNVTEAEPRFEEHRCRMIRANIPASPNSGPGSCQNVRRLNSMTKPS